MFKGEKADLVIFGFVLIMIILVSGLFSCMVHVVSRQSGKLILIKSRRNANNKQKSLANKRVLLHPPKAKDEDRVDNDDDDYEEADCRCYSASAAKEDILY